MVKSVTEALILFFFIDNRKTPFTDNHLRHGQRPFTFTSGIKNMFVYKDSSSPSQLTRVSFGLLVDVKMLNPFSLDLCRVNQLDFLMSIQVVP